MDNSADPRAAIRRLIGENNSLVANNLHDLFARTVEDLVAAGLDHVEVANAIAYVASCHQQAILGTAGLVNALRDLADFYERRLMNSQNSELPN